MPATQPAGEGVRQAKIERHYTPREAAPLLHLSERHVREAVTRGTLAAVNRNGRWLIPASAIAEHWSRLPGAEPKRVEPPARKPAKRRAGGVLKGVRELV